MIRIHEREGRAPAQLPAWAPAPVQMFVLAALTILSVSGCAVLGSAKDRELRNNPSFQAGYEDGCDAATAQGADLRSRPVGNPELYKGDDVYRAGWSNGYQTCRATISNPGGTPGSGAISVPGPGH